MPTKSKIAAEPRIRNFHNKSRRGCRTCKIRRVKCDEARPVCQRCRKAQRECLQDHSDSGALISRNKFHVTVMAPPPKSPVMLDDVSTISIEYFMRKTVPILRSCKPSPLWNHMLQLLHQEGPVVRSIASAIGQHQRLMDSPMSPGREEQSADSYSAALRALRKSIATPTDNGPILHAISCILIVLLESLRGSASNVLLHLQYCTRIFKEKSLDRDSSELMQDAARLIESYVLSTMTSGSFTETASVARRLVRDMWACFPAADDVAIVEQSLTADLIGALDRMSVGQPPILAPDNSVPAALQHRTSVATKEEALIEAVDEQVRLVHMNPKATAYYHFVLARSLLATVMLRRLEDPQRLYTVDLETYNRVVDLEETALAQLRYNDDATAFNSIPDAFSVGLGAISTLAHVAIHCKDFYLRRRALLVMELCPRREGVWSVEQASFMCKAIIKQEEMMAASNPDRLNPTDIPLTCQVHHTAFLEAPDGRPLLRIFWRKDTGLEPHFSYHDVEMDTKLEPLSPG